MDTQKFNSFLNNLERDDNKSLVESIRQGFNVIFESYADVVENSVIHQDGTDAVTRFTRRTAYDSSMAGNNILAFLERSRNDLSSLYSHDEEAELDTVHTSEFNQMLQTNIPKHSFEDNLGLTASDLSNMF